MEGNNDELGMDLFGEGLELNFDDNPFAEEDEQEDIKKEIDKKDIDNTDDEAADDADDSKSDSVSEDEDPEKVANEEDDDEGGDDNSPNLYSSFAQVLHEQGLLPSLDLQDAKLESIDDISTALKGEIENNVKQRLVDALGEDGYEAVTNGVPLSQLAEFKEKQQSLDAITEEALSEDVELSKRVIYQDFINQGISEQKAQRLLKRIVDSGEDSVLEDARESLESIKGFEAEQIEKQKELNKQKLVEQTEKQEKLSEELKNKIYNSEELIKGMKMTKAIKDRVFKSMTEIVDKNDAGIEENKLMQQRRQNPLEFDTKLYYLYEVTNGFSDFSKVVNTTKTSAISDLEKALRSQRTPDSGAPSYLEDSESYFGGDDEIVL